MYSPVEASGGQEQHHIRSTWHSEECNWEGSGQSDVPPSTGIWWPRGVLHKVIITLGYSSGQADIQSDLPSRDIWWPRAVLHKVIMTLHYSSGQADIQSDLPPCTGIWWSRLVLSCSKVLWVPIVVICCSTIGEVSHTLQCRRMTTVMQFIWVLQSWPGHVCRLIFLLLLLILCNFVVATTTKLHMKNNNKNKTDQSTYMSDMSYFKVSRTFM